MLGKRRKRRRYNEFCLFAEKYTLEVFEAQALREKESDAMRRLWDVEQAQATVLRDVTNGRA